MRIPESVFYVAPVVSQFGWHEFSLVQFGGNEFSLVRFGWNEFSLVQFGWNEFSLVRFGWNEFSLVPESVLYVAPVVSHVSPEQCIVIWFGLVWFYWVMSAVLLLQVSQGGKLSVV